jgi:hypothetical protein
MHQGISSVCFITTIHPARAKPGTSFSAAKPDKMLPGEQNKNQHQKKERS